MEDKAVYQVNKPELRPQTLLCFADSGYSHPTWKDVRLLMGRMMKTAEEIAALVGVNSQTVRQWQHSPEVGDDAEIPYSAWRMMLSEYRNYQQDRAHEIRDNQRYAFLG